MSARLNQAQKEKVKERIIDIAYDLFLKKGYEETKTREISKQAGIAEGTLFNYFSTKVGIYMEVMFVKMNLDKDKVVKKTMTPENAKEIIMEYVTNSFKIFLKLPKPVLREVMQKNFLPNKKRDLFDKFSDIDIKTINELENILEEMVDKHFLKPVDIQTGATLIFAAMFFEVMIYINQNDYQKQEMMDSLKKKIDFIFEGYIIG